ncbi:serine hydrolase [Streptomyces sp. NBC_00083]|uniref:serine hydrolase n=1 Tax=Streptomyces sp. NBC_00083 TaxID=2975647 RepID=UPI002256B844|nr:serine hydrolase [Streptomyces sp. NBC_00083]MCX5381875.1 serine hydrolase [Streptomyces sp. NBC_00083]
MVRTVSDDATRRLEEASVAGESPDKSEQKQSSGETTTSERDPRLALSHSPAPSGSPSGEEKDGGEAVNGSGVAAGSDSGTRAGTPGGSGDRATAVFRAPRQEDGDNRLRAAVAAWVDHEGEAPGAGADADERDPAGSGAGGSGAEGDADGGSDSDVIARAASSSAAEPGTPGGGAAPASAEKRAAAGPGADGASSGADGAGSASGKATPGADAATPGAGKASGADAGASPAANATSSAAAEATQAEGKASPAVPNKSASADTAADADETAPAKAAEIAQAAQVAKAEDTTDSDAGSQTGPDTKAGAKSGPDTEAGAKPAPDAKAGAKPVSDAKAGPGAGSVSERAGIDQPTAVFKAPAAPAVDQPTAMLKLPAPQREPAAERTSERTPERAPERASQFVPLRSDDAGAGAPARKPEPAAPAKRPEAPKVTPPPPPPVGAGTTAPGAGPAVPERAERTRQQPLPPKPPLDLLAELTNTPPPAQTAVRSTVRRFKIWTPLALLLLVVFAVVQIMRPLPEPKLDLTSAASYTFDGGALNLPWPSDGQSAITVDGVGSLGTHGEQKPAPLASVAKTMTAYVILKGHPISGKQEGDKITVDQQAEDDAKKPDESTAPIRKDQQFTEKQMLELLMIPSGNNAARLLARWDAGNEEAFIAKMNATAKELGMTSTTYTDPSGLKETTVSTPTDQLKLAQAVMQNDLFRGIVNTPQIKIPGIPTMIYNNNKILLKPGVSGIKTGSSTPAGGNLLWAADTVVDGKNQRIYGIVMGQRTGTTLDAKLTSAINNSYKLIQAVQKAVTSATVVKKGDLVGYADDGLGGRTPLVAAKDLKAVGWPGLKVDVQLGAGGKPVPHSAKAGDVVGELSIGSGNGRLTAPVELKSALTEPGLGAKLTRLG